MPKPLSSFTRHILETFELLGRVTARGMFGCTGLFLDGVMFGLVGPDDGLYMKADDITREAFVQAGCTPFTYRKRGNVEVALSYFRLPENDCDHEDRLLHWGRLGFGAAKRQAVGKMEKGGDLSDPWRSLTL